MGSIDYGGPVAVTRDIWWIGFHDVDVDMHCNPYLIVDGDEAVLIDSGSIPQFPIIMRKIIDVTNPAQISLIVASHPDPDVCSNMAVVEDMVERDDLRVAAHSASLRLIRYYGLRSSLYAVDKNNWRVTLKSGRVLEFIHTPHLHFAGSIATWDPISGTLFSSDLFGALDHEWELFARPSYVSDMDSWHQMIMPTRTMLGVVMDRFAALPIERICPQHGSVIDRANVKTAIDHLRNLPCGLDLIEKDRP
jgi:flavorubredoxin